MTTKTKTVRIPVDIAEAISLFAEQQKWTNVVALTEIIKSSTIFSDYLTLYEKNREIA